MKVVEKNHIKEKEAFDICLEKIAYRKLNMNLIDVECTFDNNKIIFYFTADGRIDKGRGKNPGRSWNMRQRILL